MWHAKGDNKGPVDLDNYWYAAKWMGFSKTQAVVLDLVKQHGISDGRYHIIWLDNLFTSARLLRVLREEGFRAAGTVRTKQTAREEIEEQRGTTKKELNKGLHPTLAQLKLDHSTQIPWGRLYGRLSDDKMVLEFA